jgi:uncharacterized damage-inducible protein DinB
MSQLSEILEVLETRLSDIQVDELRWQISPGSNSIAMLLAHLAIAEVYWINVAPIERVSAEEENQLVVDIIGIGLNDDGIPLRAQGTSPQELDSKRWDEYRNILRRARSKTIQQTSSWTDQTLTTRFLHNEQQVQYGWILAHIYEHYCMHFGQILQIRSLWNRD